MPESIPHQELHHQEEVEYFGKRVLPPVRELEPHLPDRGRSPSPRRSDRPRTLHDPGAHERRVLEGELPAPARYS
ncbi:hypothetical protein [Streptomyces zaehneri]|uniref:hypothetical protein n=1 Tax=Streptomyces zaehneri TaxID=3051180 RepID=UPI0028D2374C|nr:hypothetical protein [Streptomyces sp. DSM 40713]